MPTRGRPDWNSKLYATSGTPTAQQGASGGFPSFSQPMVKPAWASSGIPQSAGQVAPYEVLEMAELDSKPEDKGRGDDEDA